MSWHVPVVIALEVVAVPAVATAGTATAEAATTQTTVLPAWSTTEVIVVAEAATDPSPAVAVGGRGGVG